MEEASHANSILHEAAEAATMPPPKVEVTVERLEGIVWSTSKAHKNKEDLNRSVPFVTAAVEFSGTCPNMKVYHANKYPHLKNPAVESYFATLAPEYQTDRQNHSGSEIRKTTTSTTQDMGGTTTTTTTTTTIIKSAPAVKYRDGQYPLVADWHDHSNQPVKLSETNTHFGGSADASPPEFIGGGDHIGKPHLSITLPSAQGHTQRPSFIEALASPCHSIRETAESSFELIRAKGQSLNLGKKDHDGGMDVDTFSTAAETLCSFDDANVAASPSLADRLRSKIHGEKLMNLGSLMDDNDDSDDDGDGDEDDEDEQNKDSQELYPSITYQEEAEIRPVISSSKSKEIAATAIAGEPSSGVVGGFGASNSSVASPLSWMTCGSANPEIIELRVRVIPEDADEFDEMDPLTQHLAASQDLEGIAHLVFLDQIIEEGTTVMDLPLKISRGAKSMQRDSTTLSTTPRLGETSDYVTLGANAMLRVRVTVLPQGDTTYSHPIPPVVHETSTMRTNSIPEKHLPFYSRSFSKMLPVGKIFNIPTHFSGEGTEEKPWLSEENLRDSFTDQFRSVIPEDISKKAETLFQEWKAYSESWSWSKTIQAFSDVMMTGRSAYAPEDDENVQKSRTSDDVHKPIKTPAPRTCSTLSESSNAPSLADSLFSGL